MGLLAPGRLGQESGIHILRVAASPSPFALARRLADRPGLAVLASTDPSARCGRFSYVASDPVERAATLDPCSGRQAPVSRDEPLGFVPWWIGCVPYEALRVRWERPSWSVDERRVAPLVKDIEWARYDAVAVVDHRLGEVSIVADDAEAADRLASRLGGDEPDGAAFSLTFEDDERPEAHVERVAGVLDRIFDGELYQVNLARRLRVAIEATDGEAATRSEVLAAVLAAGAALSDAFPTAFGAVLETREGYVLSTSPELLLDASPSDDRARFERIATEPIKGTRRRATDPEEDAALARALDADPKERAELSMIIDVERNDVARVCRAGSTVVEELPHVVTHKTLHHRVARVSGVVRSELDREAVLASLLPSGSVTGAPKVRAMEIIAELEPMRRGLYTGGFGYFGRDGSMRLAMAIRTAVLDRRGQGEYLVGGGIVADSDPERELDETRLKALQLRAVGHER